jgi:Mn-containing catalase
MKILAQLIAEENSLADKIFIYDEKDFRDLIDDVTLENFPHLVIVSDYDKSLIEAIKNKGLTYGEHVISFQREYMKSQEKLFHNLGR